MTRPKVEKGLNDGNQKMKSRNASKRWRSLGFRVSFHFSSLHLSFFISFHFFAILFHFVTSLSSFFDTFHMSFSLLHSSFICHFLFYFCCKSCNCSVSLFFSFIFVHFVVFLPLHKLCSLFLKLPKCACVEKFMWKVLHRSFNFVLDNL